MPVPLTHRPAQVLPLISSPSPAGSGSTAATTSRGETSTSFTRTGVVESRPSLCSVAEDVDGLRAEPHATRSALSRMVKKGRLVSERRGRPVYYGLTPRSVEVLNEGYVRIWRTGAVNRHWDGRWTLLSFTLPESWQRQRHELRTHLLWAGFGPLQGASGSLRRPWTSRTLLVRTRGRASTSALHRLAAPGAGRRGDGAGRLGHPAPGPAVRAVHRAVGRRDRRPHVLRPLGRQLALQEEWRLALRHEPQLPVELLPAPWPAERAQQLFHQLHADIEVQARAVAASLFDTVPAPTSSPRPGRPVSRSSGRPLPAAPRERSRASAVDAEDRLGDADRLAAALGLDDAGDGDLQAAGDLLDVLRAWR